MTKMVLLIAPLIIVQLGLQIYVLLKILREGTANLSKPAWIVINFALNLIGPILFLILGRKVDGGDDTDY